MLLNLPVGSTLQWDVSTTCSYCESYSILRSFSMCVASNGCIGNKLRQKTLVCLHIFNSCGFYVTWWKPAITCSYLINSKQICSSELYRLMSPWHLNCIISSFTRAHTHTLGRWRRSAILKINMTSFFSADGGHIWIKFRRLVQNDMLTVVIWSKSKPDVEFQYGGRLGEFTIHWHVIPEPHITL